MIVRAIGHLESTLLLSLSLSLSLSHSLTHSIFSLFLSVSSLSLSLTLSLKVIDLPRVAAVNYHDSPLPAYAGVNATAWAIANGETSHAVSFHLIVEEVDAGDILCQVPVTIDPDDTTFSLNLKCFEAATAGFSSLVEDINSKKIRYTKQDLSKRSYYPLYKRHDQMCILSFSLPASAIYNLIRSLQFGKGYANPLGTPKILFPSGSLFIVPDALISSEKSPYPPGTIVTASPKGICVTTASTDLVFPIIWSLTGVIEDMEEFIQRERIIPGVTLPEVTSDQAKEINEKYIIAAKKEAFWSKVIRGYQPTMLPKLTPIQIKPSSEPSSLFDRVHLGTSDQFLSALFEFDFELEMERVGMGSGGLEGINKLQGVCVWCV